MSFGKNRVQYLGKYWKYHRYDKYDTYFYKNGDSLSLIVAQLAEKRIPDIENFFGYGLQKRLIFICYKSLSDFRESNIGYEPGNENSNIGGVTRIDDNKIFIYYESDFKRLDNQITAGITQVLINVMLYSGSYSNRFTNSTLIELPEWYEKGLISYLSEEWSFEIENTIKDGFLSKRYHKINRLSGENAKYAGHSFWYFIAETYGKDVIPNIVYMTRVNKNAETGFRNVLGMSLKELSPVWKEFYKERFDKDFIETGEEENEYIFKGKNEFTVNRVKISPDGKYTAFVTNQIGKYRVNLINHQTGKIKTIRKKGHKLDQITDYSYPVIAWHPGSNILIFFTEEAGFVRMYFYNIKEKKLSSRNIMFFDKVLSASYSDDGFLLALSAVIDGKTDIFIYNVSAGNFDRVTDDLAGDFNPRFIDNSSKIIYASDNRTSEIPDEQYLPKDIYIYNIYDTFNKFERLTYTPYVDEDISGEIAADKYMALTDKSGIINRTIIQYDSVVNYIDTAIHYRYYTNEKLISHYDRNIENFDLNKKTRKINDIVFKNNRYYIKSDSINPSKNINQNYKTEFRKILTQKLKFTDSLKIIQVKKDSVYQLKIDSLRNNPPENLLHPDSIPIDINRYVFETERNIKYYEINPILDTVKYKTDSVELLPTFNYLTNFYTNYLVQQVDFGFLSNSYQFFTGGAYYFNPGLNLFTKVEIYDLFEDYRISAGFRLGANFDSYEYLLSLENIKKRFDKEYVYHRQTYTNLYGNDSTGYFYGKLFLNEFYYILKFPFDQVSSVKATLSLRHDKGVFLSTEAATLAENSFHELFGGIKLEYNFDNVKNLSINLYDGTRFKVFGEFYQSVDQDYTNLFVVGGDFRFYKKIHRDFIFASRFAASSSFGKSKLLYYLGGVDNWTILNPNKQRFDYSVRINTEEDYVYQAVATNMRGFIQNARNGTNFLVINNEIRFPLVRYIANRPLNSSLLNNFQIIGFADVGSAWSGLTPLDDANAYKTEIVKRGPITVVIDKNRWPVIFGYGLGLRTKVFGYFVRMDWAWGIDNYIVLPRVFYLSLNLDF